MKPRIKLIGGVYECFTLDEFSWIGSGKTPERAFKHWRYMNADRFDLAA